LEEMLVEMTGEFPELSRVFVTERDMYLAHMLRTTAVPIKDPHSSTGSFIHSFIIRTYIAPFQETSQKRSWSSHD